MLSNLITESTTEQSIKMSGKMGPQIKRYKHQLFQVPRSSLKFNVKNGSITCSCPKDRAFDTEWKWSTLGSAGIFLCARGAASFRGCFHLLRARRQRSLQWKSLWAHETWYANRMLTRGCAAQPLPRGADRHLDNCGERAAAVWAAS